MIPIVNLPDRYNFDRQVHFTKPKISKRIKCIHFYKGTSLVFHTNVAFDKPGKIPKHLETQHTFGNIIRLAWKHSLGFETFQKPYAKIEIRF